MLLKNRIKKIAITLTSEQSIHLFILLCADGSIQRMGSGKLDTVESEMYSDTMEVDVFYRVMSLIPEKMTKQGGVFETPKRSGRLCEMDIVLADRMEKEIIGYRFLYGSKSLGLPKEISKLLEGILLYTDTWYQAKKAESRKKKKTH
ncbi:hypothetical protein K8S19_03710 [bacterium]|nr:hypothetical protein [bacterium]